MVVLVTARRSYNELHHLAAFIGKEVPEVTVVVQNINPSAGNVILGNQDIFQTRATALEARLDGVRFIISPRSFFQVNSGSAVIIYDQVRRYAALTGTERVLDLYCGTGAISLFLAPHAAAVHGIEVVDAAIVDAIANARLNRLGNCTFEAGDVAEELKELTSHQARFDLVVLNPPRKGCEPDVLRQVVKLAPASMIYVSCSPASLARDLTLLAGAGYRVHAIQPVDMFPQTPHVETVTLLKRPAGA
jgi:23S rRNA (uracil1939-C5)-methyltransferase